MIIIQSKSPKCNYCNNKLSHYNRPAQVRLLNNQFNELYILKIYNWNDFYFSESKYTTKISKSLKMSKSLITKSFSDKFIDGKYEQMICLKCERYNRVYYNCELIDLLRKIK